MLACSVDSKFSHQAWYNAARNKGGIAGTEFPVLADLKKEISRAYGVLQEETGFAQRGLFVIDPDGVVQYEVVHAGGIGRNVDEALRVLAAVQHNKASGEVCQLGWTKGTGGINPKQPGNYFEKLGK